VGGNAFGGAIRFLPLLAGVNKRRKRAPYRGMRAPVIVILLELGQHHRQMSQFSDDRHATQPACVKCEWDMPESHQNAQIVFFGGTTAEGRMPLGARERSGRDRIHRGSCEPGPVRLLALRAVPSLWASGVEVSVSLPVGHYAVEIVVPEGAVDLDESRRQRVPQCSEHHVVPLQGVKGLPQRSGQ